jgi:hypothetical protein
MTMPRRGSASIAARAASSQPGSSVQSPSMNWTKSTPGCSRTSAAKPSLRARAAENGRAGSSSMTFAHSARAIATLSSLDPEST